MSGLSDRMYEGTHPKPSRPTNNKWNFTMSQGMTYCCNWWINHNQTEGEKCQPIVVPRWSMLRTGSILLQRCWRSTRITPWGSNRVARSCHHDLTISFCFVYNLCVKKPARTQPSGETRWHMISVIIKEAQRPRVTFSKRNASDAVVAQSWHRDAQSPPLDTSAK